MAALNFQPTDRLPRDLGGMLSTSISAFAYPGLVAALGLPARLPRVHDTYQMLALPDTDVLDALGCDVVTVLGDITNAFEQPGQWHPFDFGGRLPALVCRPGDFEVLGDGTIRQGAARMVPAAHVFDVEHGGQPVDLSAELPREDLDAYGREWESRRLTDAQIEQIAEFLARVRSSSDRAVFVCLGSLVADISIGGHGGMAVFPIQCLTDPDYVLALHEITTAVIEDNIRRLLPRIRDHIDIVMMAADDWGTQASLIASPEVYRTLFLPFRRRINDALHTAAPGVKSFLHSCGAIYPLIDLIVESGFDILNPVQWPAGGLSYAEWKDKAGGRIALWGGGVNSQETLPLKTPAEVEAEARAAATRLGQGSGYVFCNIHNILAEIAPQNMLALYRAAGK